MSQQFEAADLHPEAGPSDHGHVPHAPGDVESAALTPALRQPDQDETEMEDTGALAVPPERRVDRMTFDEEAAEEDGDAVDTLYDERKDFEAKTPDSSEVPTDLVSAYRLELRDEFLSKEEVIERAKDVEAGMAAKWILDVSAAVDDPDPDSLLRFRDDYIANRSQNLILDGDTEDEGDEPQGKVSDGADEIEEGDKPMTADARRQQTVERNRAIRIERATTEADELIAMSLRYREEVVPGKTELPESSRADLEDMTVVGTQAKEDMIRNIERWTFQQSQRFSERGRALGHQPIDLIQEGNLGAIKAVEGYDFTSGRSLTTYSKSWITRSVERTLKRGGLIDTPEHIGEAITKLYQTERALRAKLPPGVQPTDVAIAKAAKMKPEKVTELRGIDQTAVSLDQPLEEGGDTTLSDVLEDTDDRDIGEIAADRDSLEQLHRSLERMLTVAGTKRSGRFEDRVVEVLRARFGLLEGSNGEPELQTSIAARLGVSREAVGAMERRGLERIRNDAELMAVLRELL